MYVIAAIMRSVPSPWLAGQAALALCCICLLLPCFGSVEAHQADLQTANHGKEATTDNGPKDVKFSEVATLRRQREPDWLRKTKPNKSASKKYAEESWYEFQPGKPKKSIYDKKYFDYLPAELKNSPETPADVSFTKRHNSRRLPRDTAAAEQTRARRHGIWYIQPVGSYSFMTPQYIYPNDWRLQYNPYDLNYRPNLHNQYLPPSTSRPIPVGPTTNAPAGPGVDIDPGMRGSFDDPQRPFVFDVVFDPSRETNYQLIRHNQRPRPGTTPSNFRPNQPSALDGRVSTTTTTVRPLSSGTTGPLPPVTQGPTSSRPSIQHNSDDDYDWSNLGLSGDAGFGNRLGFGDSGQTPVPSGTSPSTTDPVNGNSIGTNGNRKPPSKCTWAIANCCSHNSDKIRYYCFEQNQCYGAFWGENVCRRFYEPALKEIEIYYNV